MAAQGVQNMRQRVSTRKKSATIDVVAQTLLPNILGRVFIAGPQGDTGSIIWKVGSPVFELEIDVHVRNQEAWTSSHKHLLPS